MQNNISTPEQLASTVARMFFNIIKQWGFSDASVSKMLNASPLKVKSLQRFSAYFTEEQMIIAGAFLTVYNDLTLVLKEKVAEKGARSRLWMNTKIEGGKTPKEMILESTNGIQQVRDIVKALKDVVETNE